MIKASAPELLMHFSVLECGKNAFSQISDHYSEHLLTCIRNWYGNALCEDPTLAYEAVYESIRYYCDHPRRYNPEHGSLVTFLELNADRIMQQIFEREKYNVVIHSEDHSLAKHFDNERDVQLARFVLKNNTDFPLLVDLLDIGSYRIAEQLAEINRQLERVRRVLEEEKIKKEEARREKRKLVLRSGVNHHTSASRRHKVNDNWRTAETSTHLEDSNSAANNLSLAS